MTMGRPKQHIVIVAKDGSSWLGGRQYSMNLVKALIDYRGQGEDYDVSVLFKGRDQLEHYEAIRSELRACENSEQLLEPFTLGNRARWKLKRTFNGWTNPQLEEPLLRMGATFAYPVSSAIIPSADWIPDFQYHYYPDRMRAAEIVTRQGQFADIVARSQRIVLSSECAERDCRTLFPASVGRTAVLQFRVYAEPEWIASDPMHVVAKYHLPVNYALISNWLLPTKNHSFVLDALAQVPDSERSSMHIVCTGDIYDFRNPGFYNKFLNRIHALGLHNQVSILGVIPKHDQIQLLRAARFYLQPSLFEGWNTGVEEAHLFGKQILLSDIPVHREQIPPRATYFDPHDAHILAEKLRIMFRTGTAATDRIEKERAAFASYAVHQRNFGKTLLAICSGIPQTTGEMSSSSPSDTDQSTHA
jgi:glycosyltransferase involved in cell wall biosynthesis